MSRANSYALVLAVCVGTTFVLTPIVRWLALRIGVVQEPDERRVHEKTTAVLGGLAMFGGFLAGMVTAWRMDAFTDIFSGNTEPLGVVAAAAIIVVIGHVDDVKDVSAPAKMAGTVFAASVLVLAGVSMFVLNVPFGGLVQLGPDLAFPLSVLWVVAMAHAINFIDGLDGLAAGIVGIAALVFFLYTLQLGDRGDLSASNIGPLLALLVVGMCAGFLPWNVHPAKIFMGDGGALMLGVLMASSTMVVGGRIDQQWTGSVFFFYAPLMIPILVLGVPIFDTAFAIVRRAAKRTGVATADKGHLHHRLMKLGHGHRRTVFILWAWTALLSGFVLYPTYTGKGDAIAPLVLLGLLLLLYTVLHPTVRRKGDADPALDDDATVPRSAAEVVVAEDGLTVDGGAAPRQLTAVPADSILLDELRQPVVADGRQLRRKAANERARRRTEPTHARPRRRR